MRIYRVDGIEHTEIPHGVSIARDGKSTPIPPKDYPHKVEYIDTHDTTPEWILVCDHQRNFPQELATAIHSKQCHFNHVDGCSWDYESFAGTSPAGNSTRRQYMNKANAMLSAFKSVVNPPDGRVEEAAYNLAIRILGIL